MKKPQPTKTLWIKYTLAVILIAATFFSCDNLLKQTVIEDLTLEPPAMELIGANFDEEAQCYRSGFSVELSTNQRGVDIHYRLSMVGGTVQEGIYNGTPLLVGTHGKTFEFTAWCEAPQTLQSQTVGGRYYFEYQGLTAPLAAIEEVYLKTIDEGSNQLNRDSLISLENHPSSQGAQIYYTIPGHPEFPDNLYKLYEAPFLLEGNSSDQGINYTLLTHASLLGQVDTNGDGQAEDVELVPSSPDRAFGIRIRYPLTAPPEYSQPTRPEGFSAPFSLTLSHPVEGAVLHYSLDGSDPDPPKGGTLYEPGTQLPIGSNGEGTQLRVHVTSPGCRSREFVQEYWINPELCPDPVINIIPDLAGGQLTRSAVITLDSSSAVNRLNSQVRYLEINRHFELELSTAEMPRDGKIFYTLNSNDFQLPLFEQDAQGQYQAVGLNGTREYTGVITFDDQQNWDWIAGEELWLCTQTVAPDRTPSPPSYTRINLEYLPMPEPVFRWVDGENSSNNGLLHNKTNFNNTANLQLYVDLPEELDHIRDGLTFRCDVVDKDNPGIILYKITGNSEDWNISTPIQNLTTTEDTFIEYEYRFTWDTDQLAPVSSTLYLTMDRDAPLALDPDYNFRIEDLFKNTSNQNFYLNSHSVFPRLAIHDGNSGIKNFQFTLGGQTIITQNGNNAVNLFDFDGLTGDNSGQGSYEIEVRRQDYAGNLSDPVIFSFEKDTIAPEGTVTIIPTPTGYSLKYYCDEADRYQYAYDIDGNSQIQLNYNSMPQPSTTIPYTEHIVREIPIHTAFLDYANNLSEIQSQLVVSNCLFAAPGSESSNATGTFDNPRSLNMALNMARVDGYLEVRLLEGSYEAFPRGTHNFSIRGGYNVNENGVLVEPSQGDYSTFNPTESEEHHPIEVNSLVSVTFSNLKWTSVKGQIFDLRFFDSISIQNCVIQGIGASQLFPIIDGINGNHIKIEDCSINNIIQTSANSSTILLNSISEIEIQNSRFMNIQNRNGFPSLSGGVMHITANSMTNQSPTQIYMRNNLFRGNSATNNGGVIYIQGNAEPLSQLISIGNTYKMNSAQGDGSAIYVNGGSAYFFSDRFEHNPITKSLIYFSSPSNSTSMVNCNFYRNNQETDGNSTQLVYIRHPSSGAPVYSSMVNNLFYENYRYSADPNSFSDMRAIEIRSGSTGTTYCLNNAFSSSNAAQGILNPISITPGQSNYPYLSGIRSQGEGYESYHNETQIVSLPVPMYIRPSLNLDNDSSGNIEELNLEEFIIFDFFGNEVPRLNGQLDIGAYEQ